MQQYYKTYRLVIVTNCLTPDHAINVFHRSVGTGTWVDDNGTPLEFEPMTVKAKVVDS
jgi:hypothetical protein